MLSIDHGDALAKKRGGMKEKMLTREKINVIFLYFNFNFNLMLWNFLIGCVQE